MAVHSSRFGPVVGVAGPNLAAFSYPDCEWNEYQNEYQSDSCGYVRICDDRRGLGVRMCHNVKTRFNNRAIPTLASKLNAWASTV